MLEDGFPHNAATDAQILILGSMPSRQSLDAARYYAHPRNAFWPIMARLFGFSNDMDYQEKLACLREHHIALWDIAHQCIRPGSLDSSIQNKSVICNDFIAFFDQHPHIRAVCFNGRKAEQLYRQRVSGNLPTEYAALPSLLLPSTSPAYAAIGFKDKLAQWQQIQSHLLGTQSSA